jgi:hypothetical protein
LSPSPRAGSRHAAAPASARKKAKCPVCGKPISGTPLGGKLLSGKRQAETYRPFCSKRCADIDLARWLDGRYAIPGPPADNVPTDSGDEETDEGR